MRRHLPGSVVTAPALAAQPGSVVDSHDVTESAEIVRLWAGVKQALLFTVAYMGLGG